MLKNLQPSALTPDLDMTVLDAFELARSNSMHLISNGVRIIISPHIPPDWREIPIRIKKSAANEELPCAA
jgi:hypothetical protein